MANQPAEPYIALVLYAWLANAVLVAHLGFILFVALGALAVWRWPRLALLHVPCAVWGVLVEVLGWTCPLTPLEIYFRRLAGQQGWEGDFIERYLLAVIYPAGLERTTQILLGLGVLAINAVLYTLLLRRRGKGPSPRPATPAAPTSGTPLPRT